ncbi:MAG: hypothetical protein H6740_23685 [Alphaproteobacteria bacterium]|nr:hypothetical protein [Alphaproteobacteria bacterium]
MRTPTTFDPGRPDKWEHCVWMLTHLVLQSARLGLWQRIGPLQCGVIVYRRQYLSLDDLSLAAREVDVLRIAQAELERHLPPEGVERMLAFIRGGVWSGHHADSLSRLKDWLMELGPAQLQSLERAVTGALYLRLRGYLHPAQNNNKIVDRKAEIHEWLCKLLLDSSVPGVRARHPEAEQGCPFSLTVNTPSFVRRAFWGSRSKVRIREVALESLPEQAPAHSDEALDLRLYLQDVLEQLLKLPLVPSTLLLLDLIARIGHDAWLGPLRSELVDCVERRQALCRRLRKASWWDIERAMEAPPPGLDLNARRARLGRLLLPSDDPEDDEGRQQERWRKTVERHWAPIRKLLKRRLGEP